MKKQISTHIVSLTRLVTVPVLSLAWLLTFKNERPFVRFYFSYIKCVKIPSRQ